MERVNKKSVKVSSVVDLPDEILLLLTFTRNILIVGVKFQGTFKDHLRTAECPKDSANMCCCQLPLLVEAGHCHVLGHFNIGETMSQTVQVLNRGGERNPTFVHFTGF